MVDQKTDIFSFGTLVSYRHFAAAWHSSLSSDHIQVTYVLSRLVIFAYDSLEEDQTPELAVFRNRMSYLVTP